MTDDLLVERSGSVLSVTFNRAAQRNAMTWEMYQGLEEACETADADPEIRSLVLRGAGGKAFVAGTDIGQFVDFDGERGIAYEAQIGTILSRLQAVDVPVIAAVEGFCVGGGLGIAAMADIRICTPDSKFGVPIARTLGNCLSVATLDRLVTVLGRNATADMLLTGRILESGEALRHGLVTTIVDDLDAEVAALTERIAGNAPLTLWAIKEGLRRVDAGNPEDDDIVARIYGSEDFAMAVRAFMAKEKPVWRGR